MSALPPKHGQCPQKIIPLSAGGDLAASLGEATAIRPFRGRGAGSLQRNREAGCWTQWGQIWSVQFPSAPPRSTSLPAAHPSRRGQQNWKSLDLTCFGHTAQAHKRTL